MEIVIAILIVALCAISFFLFRLNARLNKVERDFADILMGGGSEEPASIDKTAPAVMPKPGKVAASQATTPTRKSAPARAPDTKGGPWRQAAGNTSEENSALLAASGHVPAARPKQPKTRYVFSAERFSAGFGWAKRNWFYLVAASSLALAGVFLVQYGVENGLLPPELRVAAALVLGLALIVAGEYLRRKGGDGQDELFAYLPSTLASGGLVSLFAGILSARVLYGLIAAETALAGLAIVGVVAVVIGWFYGPLLAAIGILGAVLAPFIVGGEPGLASLLFGYFAVIAVAGMAVDALKRWAWLSAFATVLTFVAAFNVFFAAGGAIAFIGFAFVVLIAAAVVPEWRLVPQQSGTMIVEELVRVTVRRDRLQGATGFPTRLAAGVFAASVVAAIIVVPDGPGFFWLSMGSLFGMFLLAAIWMKPARALGDLALLPFLAMPFVLWAEARSYGSVYDAWWDAADRLAEEPAPWTLQIILVLGIVVSLVAAWRSYVVPC